MSNEISMMKCEELSNYANNSRVHSEEQIDKIVNSIKEFGFINPVIVDGSKTIIAGHGRLMAAKKMGLVEVPCIRVTHLTESQIKAYVIADNKIAQDSTWNEDLLKQEILSLQEAGVDATFTGFSDGDLKNLFLEKQIGVTDAFKEWQGMPEFTNEDRAHRKIMVSFRNEEDLKKFFELIGQTFTEKTWCCWFPKMEIRKLKDQKYE
jgi:hypothetical protein